MSDRDPGVVLIVGMMRGVGPIITDADDAFLSIVGYTREELEQGRIDWVKMTPDEYLHLDESGIRQASRAGSGGFTAPYQKEFIRKDGSRVPVLLVCAFIPGAEGTWMGYVVNLAPAPPSTSVVTDAHTPLTEPIPEAFYTRLLNELVRERARMHAMLDTTGALIWAADATGRLIGANVAFQNAQRELSGRTLDLGEDLLTGDAFSEEVRNRWGELFRRGLTGERFSEIVATPTQPPRYLKHVVAPIRGLSDAAAGVAVVATDVTNRIRTEQSLRASEARFRTLAASAPLGICLFDEAGQITYANPRLAQILEYPAERLTNERFGGRIHAEDLPRIRELWRETLDDQRSADVEFRIVVPSAGERHLHMCVAPALDGERLTGYVGTIWDETERHEVQARSRQREKMESLGTLAGGIAHDFNNLLGVILVAADELTGMMFDLDRDVSYVDEIQRAALRARELVRQILTFSRRNEQVLVPVDLIALVQEGMRMIRALVPANVEIEVHAPPGPLVIRGDATALHQVLLNLCSNAVDAMAPSGRGTLTITLVASSAPGSPGHATLVVADTGTGMTPAVKARAFEPFFTTKPVGAGTGMGLAVVHGIIDSHAGQIEVDTEQGHGTTFRIRLPLAEGGVAQVSEPARALVPRTQARVLLVEDERPLAHLTARLLESMGMSVTISDDGVAGLRTFLADPEAYDLVITDLALPGLTGDKVAQAIHVVRPSVPVLLVTGFSARLPSDWAPSRETALLTKPFKTAELAAAIQQLLARQASA